MLKNRQASKQKGTSKSRSSTYESAVQLDLYHVFIDFKKAFDRVWYAALRATMKKYISANLIQVIRNLYDEATSAVLFNGSIGDWFRVTVGVVIYNCPKALLESIQAISGKLSHLSNIPPGTS